MLVKMPVKMQVKMPVKMMVKNFGASNPPAK